MISDDEKTAHAGGLCLFHLADAIKWMSSMNAKESNTDAVRMQGM